MNYAEMWMRVRFVWAGLVLFFFLAAISMVGLYGGLESQIFLRSAFGYGVLAAAAAFLPLWEESAISLRLLLAWIAMTFCGAATKSDYFRWEPMIVMSIIGLVAYGIWLAVLWIYSGLKKEE